MVNGFSDPRLQPFRLVSGLVLFSFAMTHFANHAAGLIGLAEMNQVQDLRLHVTQSIAGRIVLVGAALTHVTLGLGKLATRRTLRMPAWEWAQILSGILIPVMLIPHAVGITYLSTQTSYFYSYTSVAYLLWPAQTLWQSALLLVVWVHGCIGLNFWLRTKPWFESARLPLLGFAVALPILALTGFVSAAREAHTLFTDPVLLAKARAELSWPTPEVAAAIASVRQFTWATYAGILAVVIAVYAARRVGERGAATIAVSYSPGTKVNAPVGSSLLEISRMNGIPHASVCGGRARCSTCRVRVDQGIAALPEPDSIEQLTLTRIGAPPNVRLACQLRPTSAVSITRLVAPATSQGLSRIPHSDEAGGVEKTVAILFLDVRGFTKLSEDRLPFDVVFLLNQFFAAVGEAIRAHDGWIDKYMGDGLMAVFGREAGVETGCRQALDAARAIDHALDDLNGRLSAELAEGLKIGIGIHAGPVVIGRIGATDSAALTVIGRTVNEASRLEALTKEKGCQLIVSRLVAENAGLPVEPGSTQTIEVRGTGAEIEIIVFKAARELPNDASARKSKERVVA